MPQENAGEDRSIGGDNAAPNETGVIAAAREAELTLDGFWERGGRSPATAALILLLGAGAFYFLFQTLLITIIQFVYLEFGRFEFSGDERLLERAAKVIKAMANPLRLVIMLTQWSLLLLPVLWFVRRAHTRSVAGYIRFRKAPLSHVLLASLITLLLLPASAAFSVWVSKSLGMPPELEEIGAALFSAHSLPELAWLILVIAVTPAVCEETLFRGYAQRTLARVMGWKSILLVGLIFGLYHFQPLGLLPLMVLGVLFGFFFYRSDSILPAIAAHFTNNAAVVVLYYLASGHPDFQAVVTGGFSAGTTVLSSLAAASAFLLYLSLTRVSRNARNMEANPSSVEGE